MESVTATPTRKHNWTAAKRDWIAGKSVHNISEEYGIPKATIYNKASVASWPKRNESRLPQTSAASARPTIAQAIHQEAQRQVAFQLPTISQAIRNEMTIWFKRTLSSANKLHDQLDSSLDKGLDVDEIKSLATTLELVDRVARRTFGLDQNGSVSAVSGLSAVAQPWSGSAIIDVTPEPAQLPQALPEAQQTPTVVP